MPRPATSDDVEAALEVILGRLALIESRLASIERIAKSAEAAALNAIPRGEGQ